MSIGDGVIRRQGLTIDSRVALLDALRERSALSGAKKGCDHGQCGACTVIIAAHLTKIPAPAAAFDVDTLADHERLVKSC